MTSNMLLCQTHKSNNNICCLCCYDSGFCSFKINQINKPNYHPQNNIFSLPLNKHVLIKSIEIPSYGLIKINKCVYNLNFLLCINLMFNISHKCVCNVLHPSSS